MAVAAVRGDLGFGGLENAICDLFAFFREHFGRTVGTGGYVGILDNEPAKVAAILREGL